MGSFAAQDKKALAGGTLPVPMTWIDGGGQLPYSHVVIDVSGSMIQSTFVPNVGPDKHSRMEYVYFLLRTMLDNGAITKNTKLYPMGDYHHTLLLVLFLQVWFLSPPKRVGHGALFTTQIHPTLLVTTQRLERSSMRSFNRSLEVLR